MFQKRPSPHLPICPKKNLQKEASTNFIVETDDVRIEKSKRMEIGDVEFFIDEDLRMKTEPVDDEYNSKTNVVKERSRQLVNKICVEGDIKIIEIDNELKVDFVDPKKCRPIVCVKIDTKKIQGPSNLVNNASLLNRLAIYQKTLQSIHCAICKVRNTLTMHIISLQNGTFDIYCSNCGLRIQNPQDS